MILIDWSIYEKGNQEDCKKNTIDKTDCISCKLQEN